MRRFDDTERLPARIFHSVGRYESSARFKKPARELREILNRRRTETNYQYVEIGSGHSLVAFRSVLPEALAWTIPPQE